MLRRCTLLLALFLPLPLAHAQYKVGKVLFNGAPPEQQAALAQTVQLHTGQAVSQADLQTAAQRLSDTGAFDDVQVGLSGATNALDVTFTLKPLPPTARLLVSFQNFFWFTPAELQAGLHQRVPLFGPTLPESGNLVDAVQAALEDMLRQRSIVAKVEHDTAEPSETRQDGRVINFRVSTPSITVQTVHLAGVNPQFVSDLRSWITRVTGTSLNQGLVYRTTETRLLTPYVNSGYVTAHLADLNFTPATASPNKIGLDLSGTVIPGPLLRIASVTWAGSPELSSAAFAQESFLKPGEPAALINLEKTSDLLAAPYRKQGFADAVVHSGQSIDAAAGTVSYTFTVTPGEQYRIRSIKAIGLTPEQQSAYSRSFQLKAGDLFNPDYVQRFFGKDSTLEAFKYNTATYRAERDPAAHLVDITITVMPAIQVDAK